MKFIEWNRFQDVIKTYPKWMRPFLRFMSIFPDWFYPIFGGIIGIILYFLVLRLI